MLKKTFILAFLISILILLTAADFNYREDDWYKVEDWEVEVCSKWGGTGQASTHTGGVMSTQFHRMAATVQGKLINISEGDGNMYIYEVSWYLQPMNGSQSYKVILDGENNKTIATGSAPSTSGDSGYYAEENLSETFNHVILQYESGKLKAPIVKDS